MDEIVSYAKSVLFFLLFVNLVMQLLKGSSYERFVQPVCGMVLVIMIVRPVLALFDGDEKVLYAAEQKLSLLLAEEELKILPQEGMKYEFAVLEAYEKELTVQLSEVLKEEGLTIAEADFSLSAEEKDFGTVRGLWLTAEKKVSEKKGSIEIAPIVFEGRKEEETADAEEIRIKDKLADFYRMDETNIHVTIKEAQDG